MILDISRLSEKQKRGFQEVSYLIGAENGAGTPVLPVPGENLYINESERGVEIGYSHETEFFKGLFLYCAGIKGVRLHKSVKELGIMLDCSRNAVMRPQQVKKLICLLACMGYTYLELYTEDTFEVDKEPYFGYMRGRYTKQELKELDSYASIFGIELIPCVQTLAHLDSLFLWKDYMQINDTDDILMIGEERTYRLIDNIFKTVSKTFTSRNINIGMDEAHLVGLGKYLDKNGYRNRYEILYEHLSRICEIAAKYGLKPAMWSDMFFRLAFNGVYYPAEKENKLPEEVISKIPPSVRLIYWDYYHDKESDYDRMMKLHNQTGREIVYAGGAWSWTGGTPRNAVSIRRMRMAADACCKNGINNFLVTVWGNDGGECSCFAMLPSLCAVSEKIFGNEENLCLLFNRITGVAFEDFMKLDYANEVAENMIGIENPSKYMLYNDFFYGLLDSTICGGEKELYRIYMRRLKPLCEKGEYAYLFKTQYDICRILSVKFDIATRTKELYDKKDADGLRKIVRSDYKRLAAYFRSFKRNFSSQWLSENKPFGWEVLQLRIDGMIGRLEYCRRKLIDLLDGKIKNIEELDEEKLDYRCNESEVKKHLYLLGFEKSFTASKLSLYVNRN